MAENVISIIQMPDFALEDFESGHVFEWLLTIESPYQRKMAERNVKKLAKQIKFTDFTPCYEEYIKEVNKIRSILSIHDDSFSEFLEQPLELNVGEWTADETGIWKRNKNGDIVIACKNPIMPVQRLVSIDTDMEKVKLRFRIGNASNKRWKEIIVPRSKISKANDIIALADNGVSVTSGERAQALVDYLRDLLDKNEDTIPEVKAVSRMGWNDEGFSPYVSDVVFDSADSFRPVYKSIAQVGSFDQWITEALDARSYSLTARIVLASSFASVLVEPLGCLPFFVHLWSMDAGTGKTVAMMLGASVWANPALGGSYLQTFKSTSVGVELLAGFLHSLPLFMDELQLAKDSHGKVNFNVYELAAGTGKLRGNKSLGLDYTPKWSNCFITSGESPLVSENVGTGAGAVNRVIDVECRFGEAVIKDGHRTAEVLKRNYGYAGKLFVEKLCEDGMIEKAQELYEQNYTNCIQNDTTGKQAMAAAIIITADQLATEWIFQDNHAITASELDGFLKRENEASASERGYDYICGWIASNERQFDDIVEHGEHYGVFRDGYAIINRTIWNRVCESAGINSKALLSHMKTKGLLQTGNKGYTKNWRIDKHVPVPCVWLKLPQDQYNDDDYDLLP